MLTTALLRIQPHFHGYNPFTMTTARFLWEQSCFSGYGTVTMLTGYGGSKEVVELVTYDRLLECHAIFGLFDPHICAQMVTH